MPGEVKNEIAIGDPVKVRAMDRVDGEIWIPATVTGVLGSDGNIAVAFSDGERMAVQRGNWKRP
jgi:hypothetical protein